LDLGTGSDNSRLAPAADRAGQEVEAQGHGPGSARLCAGALAAAPEIALRLAMQSRQAALP